MLTFYEYLHGLIMCTLRAFEFQLTKYVTEVDVFRNQAWSKIDSRNIVPGDVVKVASDWLLPCDLVIIRG